MKLVKLALFLTASVLIFGCTSKTLQTQSSPTPSQTISTPVPASLKVAIQELQMIQSKVKSNLDYAGYAVILHKTQPIIQQAHGDAQAVTAVKSAFQGHQLALKFWKCDRLEGYEKLHRCRGQALAEIFAKYPDIETQVKAMANSPDLATLSVRLNKDELLTRIWKKTSIDTNVASQLLSFNLSPKPSP
jgi:hypothetical protein